mmetsp:Transcript_16480/g.25850  ORF Transcript_16480/g.25850 Transcript_16480/m.25850 type:complete len:208 (+) Transcript_16480:212-835(+)
MILPIMFFLVFAGAAIILQIVDDCSRNNRKRGGGKRVNLLGRISQLDLFAGQPAQGLDISAKDDIEMEDSVQPKIDPRNRIATRKGKKKNEGTNSFTGFPPDNCREEKVEEEFVEFNSNIKRSVTFNDISDVNRQDGFGDAVSQSPLIQLSPEESMDDNYVDSEGETPKPLNNGNGLNRRIQKIVESGEVDEFLKCLQEMRRQKKLQ